MALASQIMNDQIDAVNSGKDNVPVLPDIPQVLIEKYTDGNINDIIAERRDIEKYYRIYRRGKDFIPDTAGGDYVPSHLRFKLTAQLIDKEARFMFAETPDIVAGTRGNQKHKSDATDADKKKIDLMQEYLNKVFEDNQFEDALVKAAKDCFVGKRVAGVLNFDNETDGTGITLTFLPSYEFDYKMSDDGANTLERFTTFSVITQNSNRQEVKILVKNFTLDDKAVYVEEKIYNGNGDSVSTQTAKFKTKLKEIPAFVFTNDGLLSDTKGQSEVELILNYEEDFSMLSNADKDSLRKSMHPIRYAVDMERGSTSNLSSSPGSFWDLASDQNNEKVFPSVGLLESQMSYSEALKKTLERIKGFAHSQIEVPDLSSERMGGQIVSAKALKATYWPLIVRCKEKMKSWNPGLKFLARMMIEGGRLYPKAAKKYTEESIPEIEYEIKILPNYPLPEDEMEERQMDIVEVQAQTMSRKAYMQKWRELSDSEAQEELEQIAYETMLLSGDLTGMLNEFRDDMGTPDKSRERQFAQRPGRNAMDVMTQSSKRNASFVDTSFEATVTGQRKAAAQTRNETFGSGRQTVAEGMRDSDTNADRRRKNNPSPLDIKPKKKAGGR